VLQITIGTDAGTELKFDPGEVTAQPGAHVRVTFENRSEVPHNLTFEAPINVASSPVVAPATSETLELTAPGPGEYAFVCTIHPGMEGELIVAAS
jgi:plastocyanin